MYRTIGRLARFTVETVLLPFTIVIAIEAWWRLSSPDPYECRCGCDWQKGLVD